MYVSLLCFIFYIPGPVCYSKGAIKTQSMFTNISWLSMPNPLPLQIVTNTLLLFQIHQEKVPSINTAETQLDMSGAHNRFKNIAMV